MKTEHTITNDYLGSLLTIAELIKAIVEEMIEQEAHNPPARSSSKTNLRPPIFKDPKQLLN